MTTPTPQEREMTEAACPLHMCADAHRCCFPTWNGGQSTPCPQRPMTRKELTARIEADRRAARALAGKEKGE